MPILHIRISPSPGRRADGNPLIIHPVAVLQEAGPRIQVSATIPDYVAKELMETGIAPPAPATGYALIDTGASNTCIDEGIARSLGLPVVDVGRMASASHASAPCKFYPIRFNLSGSPIDVELPKAMGATPAPQGIIMLIGRDVLQNCTFHYNGANGEFTIAM